MSEIIRQFNGRVEIIYGKEEDTGNTTFRSFKDGQDPLQGNVLAEDISNTLKSLNVSNIEYPVFELNVHMLMRKARLYDSKRIFLGNVNPPNDKSENEIEDIRNDNCIMTEFSKQRLVYTWSLSGIRYKLRDASSYIEVVELPTNFIVELHDKTNVTFKKKYAFNLQNGEMFYDVTDMLTGIATPKALKATSEEILLNFNINGQPATKVIVRINSWHVCKRENGRFTTNDKTLEENNYIYGKINRIKLTKCFDNKVEIYDSRALTSFEINKQLSDSEGDINYGIVSNTFKTTLLNVERKFDVGYLKDRVSMGKRIVPYIIEKNLEKRLGTFYISSWKIPMDNSWVDVEANDKLFELHDVMFPGFMPEKTSDGKLVSVTMYDIIVSVLEYINEVFFNNLSNEHYDGDDLKALIVGTTNKLDTLNKSKTKLQQELGRLVVGSLAYIAKSKEIDDVKQYIEELNKILPGLNARYSASDDFKQKKLYEGIDLSFLDIVVDEPYIERQSVWDVLDNIAKSTMSYIYLDNNERLIFVSDMRDNKYLPLDYDLIRYCEDGKRDSIALNKNYSTFYTITPSNAFSMSKPKFRKAYATEVTTSYSKYDFLKDSAEANVKIIITYYLVDEKPYKIDDEYNYYKCYIPKFINKKECIPSDLVELVNNNDSVIFENNREYYECKIKKSLLGTPEYKQANLVIKGAEISSESTEIPTRSFDAHDHKEFLSYECGYLINNESKAKELANRIIELFSNGREVFEVEWIGDLALDLYSPIEFTLLHDVALNKKYRFKVVSINTFFDGGLKQNIKSVSYKK